MSTTTTTTPSLQHGDTAATVVSLAAASQAFQEPTTTTEGDSHAPEIRPYNPETDREGVEAVFREVYTPLYRFSGLTTIAWIVFCRAYLDFSPETCFVLSSPSPSLEAGSQRILGYLVGTPSSSAFCAAFAANQGACRTDIEAVSAAPRMEEMRDPELVKHCMTYFRQRNMWVSTLSSGMEGVGKVVFSSPEAKALLAENYPAHFHMTLAPEVQRCGFGAKLVGAFSDKLRAMGGVRGVFAATPAHNEAAEKLYTRCGFAGLRDGNGQRVGVLGGGEGEMEGKVMMVRSIL